MMIRQFIGNIGKLLWRRATPTSKFRREVLSLTGGNEIQRQLINKTIKLWGGESKRESISAIRKGERETKEEEVGYSE